MALANPRRRRSGGSAARANRAAFRPGRHGSNGGDRHERGYVSNVPGFLDSQSLLWEFPAARPWMRTSVLTPPVIVLIGPVIVLIGAGFNYRNVRRTRVIDIRTWLRARAFPRLEIGQHAVSNSDSDAVSKSDSTLRPRRPSVACATYPRLRAGGPTSFRRAMQLGIRKENQITTERAHLFRPVGPFAESHTQTPLPTTFTR
jgi:hypothetical protein